MAINNSREFLALFSGVTDHLIFGRNREIVPGTFMPEPGEIESVTFVGTSRNDTLIGGGGETFTFFLGSAGNDLYGLDYLSEPYSYGAVDYSNARRGVFVDMNFRGSRTFTDESGDVRTVEIIGRAWDGLGGVDSFMEQRGPGFSGLSSVTLVFGSSHRDVMIDDSNTYEFLGGRGDDLMIGGFFLSGGDGDDRLIGGFYSEGGDGDDICRARGNSSYGAAGEDGDDLLIGNNSAEEYLIGGAGDDRIFARGGDDRYVTGDAGNDYVDGGRGNDFIDGGVGKDILISGAGNDTINPDVEYYQLDPTQPRDGARDVIMVTRADLGAYRDTVLFNAFEEDRDQIRFGDAVRGGKDFRVYQEDNATSPGRVDTVLQIDRNGDGFGGDTPDADDYFLVAQGADLSLHHGYLLT